MSLIVGSEILEKGLIIDGCPSRLKHSTYDLTIGEIFPIGKDASKQKRQNGTLEQYSLQPGEMVLVISAESFKMPATVTGVATLRTTFTKQGLLALNVGIIDPHFEGPISTSILNFSDIPRDIETGEAFFRVIFYAHKEVEHLKSENVTREAYIKHLDRDSRVNFSNSFLALPKAGDEYFAAIFNRLIISWIFKHRFIATGIFVVLGTIFFEAAPKLFKIAMNWLGLP